MDRDTLTITIPEREFFDSSKNQFVYTKEQTITLKHSLVSVSKWEATWHKAYLGKKKKTTEELVDYVRCMTLTQNVDPLCYYGLTEENVAAINKYIEDPMTAVCFPQEESGPHRDVTTSELIYYWMLSMNIPVEFQKWHLNRLLALIRVCSIKNSASTKGKGKRMNADALRRRSQLNEQRKARAHSKG